MKTGKKMSRILTVSLFSLIAVAPLAMTGCTVYTNGMTLPTPYYHENRVQYFPRGTEFPFPNEAANLQESKPDFHQEN